MRCTRKSRLTLTNNNCLSTATRQLYHPGEKLVMIVFVRVQSLREQALDTSVGAPPAATSG